MKKNLVEEFPEIFGENIGYMQSWNIIEERVRDAQSYLTICKNTMAGHIKTKILEKVNDHTLKRILLQPIIETWNLKSKEDTIDAIIRWHMNDNGAKGYNNARVAAQIHVMKKFPEIEDLYEKRFFIKELNVVFWLRPRPHDDENVILSVDEIGE